NLNSPKQLGVILFEKMGLPVIKKTKTGYSTAVDVLEQLREQAPIVEDILTYRQIAKIQSTYVEGLLKVIQSDGKVHTRYVQTLTQTGRLSSVDPNLQNIPIRLDEGRKIRQAFVPREKDWLIYSSDYSQIELRVLAHISNDEHLKAAFLEGQDIHASTAMRVFGIEKAEDVTPNMRRQAKAVNFGIVYGISDYGLSQNLGISRKAAQQYIDTYFEKYPGVKEYMERIVREAKDQGYVETLYHRRRYLPDINSRNYNIRSFAERTAINTPIQGSAADILKIAMIELDKRLKETGLQATMLLQVHDELVFEVPEKELESLDKLVKEVMEQAVSLHVPLITDSSWGKTWYEAK
ncbi:TPA: DNA polymerase I, partial [Enterococcus faecium]|nr:DNA polymerase I [Enterococcus faecium]